MAPSLYNELEYFFFNHPKIAKCCVGCEQLCVVALCLPCLLCTRWLFPRRYRCGNYNRVRVEKKQRRMMEIKSEHREASLKRRKSLSEGASTTRLRGLSEKKVKCEQQSQSIFFQKLPAELRLKIYEYVMCDAGIIHVTYNWDRLKMKSCYCDPTERLAAMQEDTTFEPLGCLTSEDLGEFVGVWDREDHKQGLDRPSRPCLALLQSCRRIYTEAIGMLYEKNTFHFGLGFSLKQFSRSVPPHRLASIRSLILDIDYCTVLDESCGQDTTSMLRKMTGLQKCHVIVSYKGPFNHRIQIPQGDPGWPSQLGNRLIRDLEGKAREGVIVVLAVGGVPKIVDGVNIDAPQRDLNPYRSQLEEDRDCRLFGKWEVK